MIENYNIFRIKSDNGKIRIIEEPLEPLMSKQKEIALLLDHYPLHTSNYACKGRSAVKNSLPHAKATYILKADIHKCFPHTTKDKILKGLQLYNNLDWQEEVLANLDYCLLHGRLPTGAPTSPTLCNIALSPLDQKIQALANTYKYTYTRYVDDLHLSTISSLRKWDLLDEVRILVEAEGYKLNTKKSKWLTIGTKSVDNVVVTGIRLGQKRKTPRILRRKVRALLQNLAKDKLPLNEEANGYLAYIRSINSDEYTEFLIYYQKRFNYDPITQ